MRALCASPSAAAPCDVLGHGSCHAVDVGGKGRARRRDGEPPKILGGRQYNVVEPWQTQQVQWMIDGAFRGTRRQRRAAAAAALTSLAVILTVFLIGLLFTAVF